VNFNTDILKEVLYVGFFLGTITILVLMMYLAHVVGCSGNTKVVPEDGDKWTTAVHHFNRDCYYFNDSTPQYWICIKKGK
jgi:hypothetical protein